MISAVLAVSAVMIANSSDLIIGLAVGIPVVVVGGGTLVALRLRGRGGKSAVPTGEVVSDAPTDVELAKGAEAARRAAEQERSFGGGGDDPPGRAGRAARGRGLPARSPPSPRSPRSSRSSRSWSLRPTGVVWARPEGSWPAIWDRCDHGARSTPPPGMISRKR